MVPPADERRFLTADRVKLKRFGARSPKNRAWLMAVG
jgi:hypothetical protein